ncbi:MAG: hypothetical protein R3F17_14875 [Planctomycetota bacterium]
MEQMIEALLGTQWGEWKARVAGQLDVDASQAGKLLGGAAQQVMGLFTQGRLDLASLQTPKGVSSLLDQLNLADLAQQAGVEAQRLEGALGHVLPDLVAKAGSILGGGSGLGSILGNLNIDLS